MVDRMYEHGKAVSVATHFEIDDVIDPADTRRWITTLLDAAPRDPLERTRRPPPTPPQHRHLVTPAGRSQTIVCVGISGDRPPEIATQT